LPGTADGPVEGSILGTKEGLLLGGTDDIGDGLDDE